MLALVAAWTVGLAVPVFWPGTALAEFLNDTLTLVAYFIWCGVAYLVLFLVWRLFMRVDHKDSDGAA